MRPRFLAFNVLMVVGLFLAGVSLPYASQAQARVVEPAIQQPAAVAGLPLVDDFESGLPAGQDGAVPIGFNTFADPNSTAAISTTDADPAPSVPGHSAGNHVLKLDLNVVAWAGVTHAFENAGATAWVSQDWSAYEGISFYLYGTGAGTDLFIDVLDNRNPGSTRDDAERWTRAFKDDVIGWRLIEIPFASMTRKEIGNGAPNDGFGLTEVHGWGFGTLGTGGAKSYYLDDVLVYGVAPIKPLTVGFNTLNYQVVEGGAATITAKLSKPYTDTVTVHYATTFGLAVPDRDYAPTSGTLSFPANVTEQSFTVQTIDNAKHQGERGVLVELSNPTGGLALGMPPLARVNVLDDELYYPPLLDDFETYPYLWSTHPLAALSNPEIPAGDELALPGQGAYEHVLKSTQRLRQAAYQVGRTFPISQNWSNSAGLDFWYYGQNSGKSIQVALTNNKASTDKPSQWKLVWRDEFNTALGAAPNPKFWGNEVGDGTVYGIPGWGNDELQYYTPGGANAVTDGQGHLVITTKAADGSLQCYYGPCKYTSTRLLTKNRFEVAYGRAEARVKVPVGAGLWPAFWMLGADIDRVGWPMTGEIDIMEHVARLPNEIFGTLHGPGYSGGNSYGKVVDLGVPVADEFHTYAVEWQPDKITWFLDGDPYFTATPADPFLAGKQWVYNHPFYMLLNVAVGGNFGGAVGSGTVFPQQTLVDYVRLYQAAPILTRYTASFVDSFAGWQKVTIPFTAFLGANGAMPDLAKIQGMSFLIPGGMPEPVLLDQIRLTYDDATPPTVAITSSAAGETATGPVTFSFTFSEDVGTSFTADDIVVTGGTAGAFTRVSGVLATLVVTPPANAAGTMTVSVAAGKFYDAAYNANTEAASLDQAYDTTTVVLPGLPITFDDPAVTYTLTGFGGAEAASVVVDPAGGANQVAEVTKSATAELWAGVTVSTAPNNSIAPIPFTATAKTITVRVWSPTAGVQIRLKVEDAADGSKSCETEATTTVANAWETLTFDFANPAAGTPALDLATSYTRMSVFPNFGKTGAQIGGASTYYFDDFAMAGTVLPGLPITFDDPAVTYTLTGFGGAEAASVVVDPAGGANQVAEVTKSATAELWAGVTVSTAPNNSIAPIPFTATAKTITVRVWSPTAGVQIRLKVEDAADGSKSCETEATTTVANAWETLTFDFGAPVAGTPALNLATSYNRMSVFPNFGKTGAQIGGASTYYFDDFAMAGTVLPGLPITFDDPAVTYTLTGFGGAEAASVVTDPAGGANQVAEVTKSATAELWAGVTVSTAPNNSIAPIPFTATAKTITVRVWSPTAGVQIRLKVEDAADGSKSCETEATTTVANAWETLTFDFGAPVAGTPALDLATSYNRMSVFPNFGKTGAQIGGASTYYFDDFAMAGTVLPGLPITFDDPAVTYTLTGFGGAEAASVVVDPAGGANQVAEVTKSATAELWAGVTVSTAPNNSIAPIPFTATAKTITVRVWSPTAGVQIRLKVEDAADGSKSCETEATTTVANAWETLTFDFDAPVAGTPALNLATSYNRMSVFPNFGKTGAQIGGPSTYYFDDFAFGS